MGQNHATPDYSVTFFGNTGALITGGDVQKTTPSAPAVKSTGSDEIAPWGDDNLYPQTILTAAEKTFVPSVIDFQVRALYGRLQYGTYDITDGKETFVPQYNQDIEDWLELSGFNRYMLEAASDLYWFYNAFPEIILSNDRSKVVSISAQEAMNCRWAKQNTKGAIEKCFINANWADGAKADSPETITVPVIDPYYDPVTAVLERKEFKYIYPISFPTPGKTYYQLASWHSIYRNKWLSFAAKIPAFKEAIMKNQISIKYHIEVPDYYWQWKYPDWGKMSPDDRTKVRKDELTAFNKVLQGEENAGRSIMTTSRWDEVTKTKYPGWVITYIDDKYKDGTYIEDSQEASSHLLFALGIDGTLIGNSPGKGMGAGSGSDKRVAFNLYINMCLAHEHLILEPLNFIRRYNKWDPKIRFRIARKEITTLDQGKETKQIS